METHEPVATVDAIRIHETRPEALRAERRRRLLRVVLFSLVLFGALGSAVAIDPANTLAGGAAIVTVNGMLAAYRLRRLRGSQVVSGPRVLRLTHSTSAPIFVVAADVDAILDYGRAVMVITDEQHVLLTDALDGWEELRARLLTWRAPVRRSNAARLAWSAVPLAMLAASLVSWFSPPSVLAIPLAAAAVLLGAAATVRVLTAPFGTPRLKALTVVQLSVYQLGALARLAQAALERR